MKIAAECEKLYRLHMDGAIHTKGLRARLHAHGASTTSPFPAVVEPWWNETRHDIRVDSAFSRNPMILMAERTGLEPATPGVTGRYSNQLNYRSELRGPSEERRPKWPRRRR
jgi:hypothetical protein